MEKGCPKALERRGSVHCCVGGCKKLHTGGGEKMSIILFKKAILKKDITGVEGCVYKYCKQYAS